LVSNSEAKKKMSLSGKDAGEGTDNMLALTTRIVAAYVSHNQVPLSEVPAMLRNVHSALSGLTGAPVPDLNTNTKPAVPVKKSITDEYIICLEDGKRLKMLKRYLRSHYDMSPEQYRSKWGLPADYPMVAPNYAKQRSDFAKSIGLGRAAAPSARGRKKGKAA
jgi:predicted transcriptional regulator